MARRRRKKFKTKFVAFLAAVVAFIVIAALILYFFFPNIFDKALSIYEEYTRLFYEDSKDADPEGTAGKVSSPVPQGNLEEIVTSDFSIHFLELGNKYAGDCTLIKCGQTEVLIDAGSRTNSAVTINSYIDQYVEGKLDYVIATHAHQDHIAGFVGVKDKGGKRDGVLYTHEVGTVIQFAQHNTNSGIYNDYVAAVEDAKGRGAAVYSALQCWNNQDGAQRSYDLSPAQDGSLTLNVLYNFYYENQTKDENDYSVCVLLSHTDANAVETHYLFTGDLEGEGESRLVDNNNLPEVELFKGAHHGSKTSSTDKLLNVIKPKNVAVCCCAGAVEYTKNKDNTFPTQDFINRISKHTDNVYVTSLCIDYDAKQGAFTSMNGNIVFYTKQGALSLWCSNNYLKLRETEWFKNNRKGWENA